MTRLVSFFVLVGIVAFFGILSFEVLSSFMLPIFVAVLLVVTFRPLHRWFQRLCSPRDRWAAALTTLAILLALMLPLLFVLVRAATESASLVRSFNIDDFFARVTQVRDENGLALPQPQAQREIETIEETLTHLRDRHPLTAERKQQLLGTLDVAKTDLNQLLFPTDPAHSQLPPFPHEAERHEAATAWREQIKAALRDFNQIVIELVDNKDAKPEDLPKFVAQVREAEARFKVFRERLYGGPVVRWLRYQLRLDDDQKKAFRTEVQSWSESMALGTTQFVFSFIGELLVFVFVLSVSLFYFLADGPHMLQSLVNLAPLDRRYQVQLLNEFGTFTRAIILSLLASALAQGALIVGAYLFVGFESVFLLTVLTMVLSVVPFIGAAPVWGSCALWLALYEGRIGPAIGLALYGWLIMMICDNVLKPLVLRGRANLHPLLALLSVLGGAKALGPIGLVVGPMAVAFLQTLLVMLRTELAAFDVRAESLPGREPAPAAERLAAGADNPEIHA